MSAGTAIAETSTRHRARRARPGTEQERAGAGDSKAVSARAIVRKLASLHEDAPQSSRTPTNTHRCVSVCCTRNTAKTPRRERRHGNVQSTCLKRGAPDEAGEHAARGRRRLGPRGCSSSNSCATPHATQKGALSITNAAHRPSFGLVQTNPTFSGRKSCSPSTLLGTSTSRNRMNGGPRKGDRTHAPTRMRKPALGRLLARELHTCGSCTSASAAKAGLCRPALTAGLLLDTALEARVPRQQWPRRGSVTSRGTNRTERKAGAKDSEAVFARAIKRKIVPSACCFNGKWEGAQC